MTRFEGAFLAERCCVLGAQNVEIGFGASLFQFFLLDQAAELADFFGDSGGALGDDSNSSASWPRCPPKAST